MKRSCSVPVYFWLAACLLGGGFCAQSAQAESDLKIQAQLIWGTDDTQSPDPKHKVIDVDLATKLKASPYRWKNYFEVKRESVAIAAGQTKILQMSDRCKIEVKNVGGDWAEIKLIGEGKHIATRKEKLAVDKVLFLGGDAKNDTAWMVVIKKVAPVVAKADAPKPN